MSVHASAVQAAPETPFAASTPLIVTNNIVFNHLFEAVHTGKRQKCCIAKRKTVTFQITAGVTSELTEFDLAVLSCLNGIWMDEENPESTFSVTGLCRMLGSTRSGGISAHIQDEIRSSLQRLTAVQITIDPTADFEMHRDSYLDRNPETDQNGSWEQITGIHWAAPHPLIRLGSKSATISRTSGDKTEICYKLRSEPLLLTYSKITGQLVTIPQEYFQIFETADDHTITERRIPMTKNRIAQVFWLARQAERIRYAFEHPKKRKRQWVQKEPSEALLFSKIFQRCGIDRRTASRHKGKHVDFMTSALRCWEAQGLIPAWSLRTSKFGQDAIVFHAGTFTQDSAPAPADPPANPADPAPDFNTIIGALNTIIGALDTIIGAAKSLSGESETALSSSFLALKTAVEDFRKYFKYLKPLTPATAFSGGRGVRQIK